ncbi:unnamed protein product [Notodromas monacha]|uniref:YEATS domain-containing protein n=1 Tax=Notodromas monacha TaxID=399045 RepID=A0A7R9GB05_9CRUS|nr:unnamed protein product [Notodromas monacha]CAG0915810.1 unnamed protein product [Notodromas monacha]
MAGKQNVQVRILLGHTVKKRAFPSSEGYTHDWTVFVRGDVDVNLSCFVEKVIFTIHPSFPRPKRVVKEPPYELSESGYAGFLLKIELVFKTSLEPRSAKFDFDLFFNSDPSMDANSIRPEKLTFQKPGEDFKRKLLRGGGVLIGDDEVHQQSRGHGEETATTHGGKRSPHANVIAAVKSGSLENGIPRNPSDSKPSKSKIHSGKGTGKSTSGSEPTEKSEKKSKKDDKPKEKSSSQTSLKKPRDTFSSLFGEPLPKSAMQPKEPTKPLVTTNPEKKPDTGDKPVTSPNSSEKRSKSKDKEKSSKKRKVEIQSSSSESKSKKPKVHDEKNKENSDKKSHKSSSSSGGSSSKSKDKKDREKSKHKKSSNDKREKSKEKKKSKHEAPEEKSKKKHEKKDEEKSKKEPSKKVEAVTVEQPAKAKSPPPAPKKEEKPPVAPSFAKPVSSSKKKRKPSMSPVSPLSDATGSSDAEQLKAKRKRSKTPTTQESKKEEATKNPLKALLANLSPQTVKSRSDSDSDSSTSSSSTNSKTPPQQTSVKKLAAEQKLKEDAQKAEAETKARLEAEAKAKEERLKAEAKAKEEQRLKAEAAKSKEEQRLRLEAEAKAKAAEMEKALRMEAEKAKPRNQDSVIMPPPRLPAKSHEDPPEIPAQPILPPPPPPPPPPTSAAAASAVSGGLPPLGSKEPTDPKLDIPLVDLSHDDEVEVTSLRFGDKRSGKKPTPSVRATPIQRNVDRPGPSRMLHPYDYLQGSPQKTPLSQEVLDKDRDLMEKRLQLTPNHLNRLLELHEIIGNAQKDHDVDMMQKIVDIVEETGKYQVTEASLDFNLMYLDVSVIQKLFDLFHSRPPSGLSLNAT